MKSISAVILAAGKSKRMKTRIPKVLHKVAGIALIDRVLNAVESVNPVSVYAVVGYEKEQIISHLGDRVKFAEQKELLGTGYAVMQVVPYFKDEEDILVICGDMPLISGDMLNEFMVSHKNSNAPFSLMSAIVPWESDFGRIIRDEKGGVSAIREFKDANDSEKQINEVNLALYIVKKEYLIKYLPQIKSENSQKEFYLTDLVSLIVKNGEIVNSYICKDPIVSKGVNSRSDLAELNDIVRRRKIYSLMNEGVTFIDPGSCFIDENVKIGMDTVIKPFTIISGNTVIGEDCIIGPSSSIENALISNNVTVANSIIISSEIGEGTSVGPFAYIRPDNIVGKNVKIGDFVELKKSRIGNGTKVPHLSYVGDAVLGEMVNIGAGTITCNYDGKNKHQTVIGDGTHIGSNTNLVAPVNVGKNAVTGAGAVVTKDIPDNSTAVGVPARIKNLHY